MIPIALVTSFASLMLELTLLSKSYSEAVQSLVKDEVARDMRRIKRRYFRDSAQGQEHIRCELPDHKGPPSEDMDRVIG